MNKIQHVFSHIAPINVLSTQEIPADQACMQIPKCILQSLPALCEVSLRHFRTIRVIRGMQESNNIRYVAQQALCARLSWADDERILRLS
jgi:hypothetical protein